MHLGRKQREGEGTDEDGEEDVHDVTSTRCKKIYERLYACKSKGNNYLHCD